MTDETDLETTPVVTVFLRQDAAVLLFRRSGDVGSYSGRWAAVAGHVATEADASGDGQGETGADAPGDGRNGTGGPEDGRDAMGARNDGPDAAARREIREETGLDPDGDLTLVRAGDPFDVVDADRGTRWVVHPYLFDCGTRAVETNYETDEYEWVPPTEILRRETVPDLWTSYDRVRPTVETVAGDRDHGSAYLSVRALEVLRDEAALAVEGGAGATGGWEGLASLARDLRAARPTMPAVENRVNRAMADASEGRALGAPGESRTPRAVEAAASEVIDRALDADGKAAAMAADCLPDRVATLSRSGTVLSAVERADPEFVLVAESRPGREGAGVAERLASGPAADVTLTTDAAFAARLAAADVGALVVGADAVLSDGSVVNKVGTRGAATVADREEIDCVVVAASDKVAPAGTDAADREERDPREVYDGPADLAVANPTFDVTPPDRVTAVVTEAGALDAAGIRRLASEHRARANWE